MYVDKEDGGGRTKLYDPAGALFKTQIVLLYPAEIPKTGGDVVELLSGPNVFVVTDNRADVIQRVDCRDEKPDCFDRARNATCRHDIACLQRLEDNKKHARGEV